MGIESTLTDRAYRFERRSEEEIGFGGVRTTVAGELLGSLTKSSGVVLCLRRGGDTPEAGVQEQARFASRCELRRITEALLANRSPADLLGRELRIRVQSFVLMTTSASLRPARFCWKRMPLSVVISTSNPSS